MVVPGLTIPAVISSALGAFGINKQGAGTVVFDSTAANTYTGTTTVNEGTLLLSGTGSGTAAEMVPGNLIIGDGAGGQGLNKVDIVKVTASNEIGTTAAPVAVTVNSSGVLNLNNFNNTITTLTMSGGTVNTGTGTLTLSGNVTGVANAANLTPATINGNLALGTAIRTFDIQQGSVPATVGGVAQPVDDMVINAVISGTGGINKISDPGLLLLTNTNTYTGATTVSSGALYVDGSLSPSSAISVTGSGVLGGTGTVGATVVTTSGGGAGNASAGGVDPHDVAGGKGVFTISNTIGTGPTTLDLSNAGNVTIQIGGYTTPGVSYGQLVLGGDGILKLSSTSTLTFDLAGLSGASSDGEAFGVIQYYAVEGSQPGGEVFNPANITTINNPQNLIPVITTSFNATTGVTSLNVTLAGPATLFAITSSTTATAGVPFTVTVTALDTFGNVQNPTQHVAGAYTGTVHFSSSDTNSSVVLPNNYTFTGADDGVHVFTGGVTLITATVNGVTPSPQTVVATDTVSGITGTDSVTVSPNVVSKFAVSAPSSAAAGQLIGFGVTAEDKYGNTVIGYTGTVAFSGTDPQAIYSNPSTLTNGVGFFAALLRSVPLPPNAPVQTITATDTTAVPTVSGVSGNITMTPGTLAHFGVTSSTATPRRARCSRSRLPRRTRLTTRLPASRVRCISAATCPRPGRVAAGLHLCDRRQWPTRV